MLAVLYLFYYFEVNNVVLLLLSCCFKLFIGTVLNHIEKEEDSELLQVEDKNTCGERPFLKKTYLEVSNIVTGFV